MIRTENGLVACVLLKKPEKASGYLSDVQELVALTVVADNTDVLGMGLPGTPRFRPGDVVFVRLDHYVAQSKVKYKGQALGLDTDFLLVSTSQVVAVRNNFGEPEVAVPPSQ